MWGRIHPNGLCTASNPIIVALQVSWIDKLENQYGDFITDAELEGGTAEDDTKAKAERARRAEYDQWTSEHQLSTADRSAAQTISGAKRPASGKIKVTIFRRTSTQMYSVQRLHPEQY